MGDLAAVQDQLKWGLATDCPTNPLCAGRSRTRTASIRPNVDAARRVQRPDGRCPAQEDRRRGRAVLDGPGDHVNGWVVLEDDKGTQPADNIAPIVRNDLLAKVDGGKFNKTSMPLAKIDTPTLAQLYYNVAVGHKDLKDVASAWLKAAGLVAA